MASSSSLMPESHTLLILYSALWLKTVVNVPDLEDRACVMNIRDGGPIAESLFTQEDKDVALKVVHCGQVLRLVNLLGDERPPWWPLVVYRATLVLWMTSLVPRRTVRPDTIDPSLIISAELEPLGWPATTSINSFTLEDDRIQAILGLDDTMEPVLSSEEGTMITLTESEGVLRYGIGMIERGPSSLLRNGILSRLESLQKTHHGHENHSIDVSG